MSSSGTSRVNGEEDPPPLVPGSVVWVALEPVRGREQGGHRPVVVVASTGYLEAVTTLAVVVPVTSVDRGWPNHVRLTGEHGLQDRSWAMSEQIRTVSRSRISRVSGVVSAGCLGEIRSWLSDFLDLPAG